MQTTAVRSTKDQTTSATTPRRPASPLQSKADASPYVLQLASLQTAATLRTAAGTIQLYKTAKVKGQDGHFIPAMKAAIHCHIGRKMRNPHLKILGMTYNFGLPHQLTLMQEAYDALRADPRNAGREGYADCIDYLEQEGCSAPQEDEDAVADTHQPAPPDGSRASRALIERGLAQGQYPPK